MHRTKRRKLASSTSHGRRKVASIRGIWLDKLPKDVCIRVAAHVCHREHNSNALALAKTSSMQQTAVLALLRHRLAIHDKKSRCSSPWTASSEKEPNWDTTSREWIYFMGEDLHGLFQPFLLTLNILPPRFILPVISLPNLRLATIADYPAQVAAVARSSSIQKVHLLLYRRMPAKKVFEALLKLPLTKLRILCMEQEGPRPTTQEHLCPFRDPDMITSDSGAIAKYLPHVRSISITCKCHVDGKSRFWDVLPLLKRVTDVGFEWLLPAATVSREALRFLSSRDSVQIVNALNSIALASLIGPSVSEITQRNSKRRGFDALTAKELVSVGNYPRLTHLEGNIEETAETVLPGVLQKLPSLGTLKLFWVQPEREAREPCMYTGSRFVSAAPGVMLRAVQATRRLSILWMMDVRIELTELVCILKSIGTQLRSFASSLGDQEEPPFERLEALLLVAAEHNTALDNIWFEGIKHQRGAMSVEEWKQQAQRVLVSVRFLERRAPGVSGSTYRYIKTCIERVTCRAVTF